MFSPWIGIIIVMAVLLGIMLFLSSLARIYPNLSKEIPRKMVHVSMGVLVLGFPWIFNEKWPVILLATISLITLVIIRTKKSLKQSVGQALHGVSRYSFGEIGFVLAISIVFYFYKNDVILYIIPVLVLTLADTVSAFIGIRYGRKNLADGIEDKKSFEGCFAFFSMAFIICLTCLLLFTNVGRVELLLISIIIGILVAMIEAISLFGTDNFFICVFTFLFLKTHMNMEWQQLIVQLAVICILCLIAIMIKAKTNLSKFSFTEAIFVGYVFFTFGDWKYVVVSLLLLLGFVAIPKMNKAEFEQKRDMRVVLANVIVALGIVFINVIIRIDELFYIFIVANAQHLCMNTFIRFRFFYKISNIKAFWLSILESIGLILIPSVFLIGISNINFVMVITGLISVFLAGTIAIYLEKKLIDRPETYQRDWLQALVTFIITTIAFFVMYN